MKICLQLYLLFFHFNSVIFHISHQKIHYRCYFKSCYSSFFCFSFSFFCSCKLINSQMIIHILPFGELYSLCVYNYIIILSPTLLLSPIKIVLFQVPKLQKQSHNIAPHCQTTFARIDALGKGIIFSSRIFLRLTAFRISITRTYANSID